jgi:hypothetical protein
MSTPATSSATANQTPPRENALDTWPRTESFWATESEMAEAATSTAALITAVIPTRTGRRRRVTAASVTPSANPAGIHATSMRRSGWVSPPASCWSGRAPVSPGPAESA